MKLTALFDPQGAILAAAIVDDRYVNGPVPVATRDGERVDTIAVPDVARDQPLDVLCTRFRVDASARRLVERKPSTG